MKVSTVSVFLVAAALTLPAIADAFEYGGYLRTRAYSVNEFASFTDDKTTLDDQRVDALGILWGKMQVNDEISWTNRFRFNTIVSDPEEIGGVGSTGSGDYVELLHSFVDFSPEMSNDLDLNLRIGLQPYRVARGMLFNDDFIGAEISHETDRMRLAVSWMKVFEKTEIVGEEVMAEDFEDVDLDMNFFGLTPEFYAMDGDLTFRPSAFYLSSDEAREGTVLENFEEVDLYYMGGDIDYSGENFDAWMVGFYETGKVDPIFETAPEFDFSAYLAAVGAEYRIGAMGVHGEAFYATGEEDFMDEDMEFFFVPQGQSYYWSEIMGLGLFDDYISRYSTGDVLSNITAYNIGLTYQVNEALKLGGDVWYAELAEETRALPETELGTEVDLRVDYKLNDKYLLTVAGGYLFSGDATNYELEGGDEDPWEVGMRLQYSFHERTY